LADQVLVMSVHPGFGGQRFLPQVLDKVRRIREIKLRDNLGTEIAIDGGINRETAPLAVAAGAEVLVAGAAIFGALDRAEMKSFLKGLR